MSARSPLRLFSNIVGEFDFDHQLHAIRGQRGNCCRRSSSRAPCNLGAWSDARCDALGTKASWRSRGSLVRLLTFIFLLKLLNRFCVVLQIARRASNLLPCILRRRLVSSRRCCEIQQRTHKRMSWLLRSRRTICPRNIGNCEPSLRETACSDCLSCLRFSALLQTCSFTLQDLC